MDNLIFCAVSGQILFTRKLPKHINLHCKKDEVSPLSLFSVKLTKYAVSFFMENLHFCTVFVLNQQHKTVNQRKDILVHRCTYDLRFTLKIPHRRFFPVNFPTFLIKLFSEYLSLKRLFSEYLGRTFADSYLFKVNNKSVVFWE